MKMWERDQATINKWQAVVTVRFGVFIALAGLAIIMTELFLRPGTQMGLGVVAMGIGLAGAGDALATIETTKRRGEHE